MGDGELVSMSAEEIKEDIQTATRDAARRAEIPALTPEEMEQLFEIIAEPSRAVSVISGQEVVVTDDGCSMSFYSGQDGGGVGTPMSRLQAILTYERACAADTTSMGHSDYSFKPVKPIVGTEQTVLEQTLMVTHPPLFYGAMPNLGLYSQPDGPFPNPSELMPLGKIAEARESYENAVENAVKDIVYVGSAMYESGADGINMDTTGAAGDADFLAGLKAAEILKQKYPDICIELGMAGEFILGLHGELEYDGKRLAGLYAHDQVKLAEKAGVTIFGPVVNMKTSRSCPWNLSRVITFMKACCEVARIPIHVNMGMGVGGVPMTSHPPVDITSRASKAMVEICRLDGL